MDRATHRALRFLPRSRWSVIGEGAIAASMLISQGMVAHWTGRLQKGAGTRIAWIILPLAASLGGLSALFIGQAKLAALSISLLTLVILPRLRSPLEYHEHWWELFLNHPARVLISTFLGLCLFGTLLLQLPWATTKGNIALVDAAFTSVSAVCVTGLDGVGHSKRFHSAGAMVHPDPHSAGWSWYHDHFHGCPACYGKTTEPSPGTPADHYDRDES